MRYIRLTAQNYNKLASLRGRVIKNIGTLFEQCEFPEGSEWNITEDRMQAGKVNWVYVYVCVCV